MSEGCQKSVSSPKTLETIKKVRGGVRPWDLCGKSPERNRLSYSGSRQNIGGEYRVSKACDYGSRLGTLDNFQGRVRLP